MKKTHFLTIVFVTVISFLFSGCGFLPAEDERLDPPIRETSEVQFQTETVQRGDIHRTVNMFANFVAADEMTYRFEDVYEGKVDEIYVQIGNRVQKGDLLASLEMGDLDVQLRDMELNYEVARINYQRTKDRYER